VPLLPGLSGVSAGRVGEIVRTGIPQTFALMAMSFVALVLNKIVGGIGQTEMDAWSLVTRIDQMVSAPLVALAAATITMVGQNHGKGNTPRIRRGRGGGRDGAGRGEAGSGTFPGRRARRPSVSSAGLAPRSRPARGTPAPRGSEGIHLITGEASPRRWSGC